MNGYASLNETLNQPISSTLFSINNEYYKSKYRNNYTRYFENEMLNKPLNTKEGEYLGNIYFFKLQNLEKTLNDLPNK